MAGTIRSYTVAGWAISGLAAPNEVQEQQLTAWLQRYQYKGAPSLTLGVPGTGFSVRMYKADPGYESHEYAVAIGLGLDYELVLVKDPGALVELLARVAPVIQLSTSIETLVPDTNSPL